MFIPPKYGIRWYKKCNIDIYIYVYIHRVSINPRLVGHSWTVFLNMMGMGWFLEFKIFWDTNRNEQKGGTCAILTCYIVSGYEWIGGSSASWILMILDPWSTCLHIFAGIGSEGGSTLKFAIIKPLQCYCRSCVSGVILGSINGMSTYDVFESPIGSEYVQMMADRFLN